MRKKERQRLIADLIAQSNETLETHELAQRLGVSDMTVRRDLRELADAGRLRRQHGGATPLHRAASEDAPRAIGVWLISRSGKYSDPFFNEVLEGADQKLTELGYKIAYVNTHSEVKTAAEARDMLQSTTISGVLLIGPRLGDASIEYLKANVRVLVATIAPVGPAFDAVTFDGFNGMRDMVAHLVQRGYRRLGFITGQNDARLQGFLKGLKTHGLPLDPKLRLTLPASLDGWTPELGQQGAAQLMALDMPPDAIVCASDLIAIGALQWLQQHSFRVPDDVAVSGFDDIPEAAFTVPALTTVHVHKRLIGALAAERIVRRIENVDEVPLHVQTPTYLVIRQSSETGTLIDH